MDKIRFLDDTHNSRFQMALSKIFKGNRPTELPADFLATVYLATGNADLAGKAIQYVKGTSYFDWMAMFDEQDFSSGIRVLAQLAVALFNGDGDLVTADLWRSLDERNFDLAVRAIQLRKFGCNALAA